MEQQHTTMNINNKVTEELEQGEVQELKLSLSIHADPAKHDKEISHTEYKQSEDIDEATWDVAVSQEERDKIDKNEEKEQEKKITVWKELVEAIPLQIAYDGTGDAIVNTTNTIEKSQPMEQLHAVISHQVLKECTERQESNNPDNLVEDKDEEKSESIEANHCKEPDLSPQAINKSKKRSIRMIKVKKEILVLNQQGYRLEG